MNDAWLTGVEGRRETALHRVVIDLIVTISEG